MDKPVRYTRQYQWSRSIFRHKQMTPFECHLTQYTGKTLQIHKDHHGHIQHKILLFCLGIHKLVYTHCHTILQHRCIFIHQFTKTRTYVTFLLYLPSAALFYPIFDSDSLVKSIVYIIYYFSHPCTFLRTLTV